MSNYDPNQPPDIPTTLPEWQGDMPEISINTALLLNVALGTDYVVETNTPVVETAKS